MRHRFWPRCTVTGTMITPEKKYDFKGRGVFIHALQGMKPHHAAAKWNFVTFQTPTYSALMMDFTTPPSYASTCVNVGGIAKDGEIIYAGATNTVKHIESKEDQETLWPEPTLAGFTWKGKSKDGCVSAILRGPLGDRKDRVDVLSHIPGIIKSLIGGVAGTRPYVYQVRQLIPALTFSPTLSFIRILVSNMTLVLQPPTRFARSLYQDWRRCSHRGTRNTLLRINLHLIEAISYHSKFSSPFTPLLSLQLPRLTISQKNSAPTTLNLALHF